MNRLPLSVLPQGVMVLLLSCAAFPGRAAATYLPAIGGSGGGQFFAPCPAGQNLTGFELRAGDDVDAIRSLCITNYSSGSVTGPMLTDGSGLIIHYGNLTRELYAAPFSEIAGDYMELPKDWHGGTGGGRASVICPKGRPVVVGLYVAAEGARTITVNNIHLFCGLAIPSQQLDPNPSAIFDAPGYRPVSTSFLGIQVGDSPNNVVRSGQRCSDGQVAVGIHGRSGIWLDALGLICDTPRVIQANALGRVAPRGPAGPPRPICDVAREARARNSPAAPGLERQCEASKPVVKSLGRVATTGAAGPPRTICEAAQDAAARKSPAAPSLAAQCRASDLQSFPETAKRGEILANQDPLALALRNQQSAGAGQRGFDIGMAVSEGQTANGPGKQRIHDELGAAERVGFEAALNFSLERNRNADLAARGAAVSLADPVVAQAHNGEANVFYWLGFDIATGLFGDPALGAMGVAVAGPAEMAIRNTLSAPAQRGFNASINFHLNRVRQ
jgi:hypothetical protein